MEVQGSSTHRDDLPYKMRILKQFEVCDGCVAYETIYFRFPLRGACSPYLCSTKTNVFNKFSVRYIVRLVIEVVRE